jgi:lysophospholipase L1-like esterase
MVKNRPARRGYQAVRLGIGAGMLALMMSACGGGGSAAAGTTPTPTPSGTPTPTPTPSATPIARTLNVLYYGGSVTYGAGASTPAKSWAELTTAWLRTRYTTVNERNLAVPGTDSLFGIHRFSHDLGSFVPDVAFVEFTLNDILIPREDSIASVDAIAYRLRQLNPRVKIVYVAVTSTLEESLRRSGSRYQGIDDEQHTAQLDSFDFIDVGGALWSKIIASGTPATNYFIDQFHPDDAGHEIYFEAVRDYLIPQLPFDPPANSTTFYQPQSNMNSATLQAVSTATGCRVGTTSQGQYFEAPLTCNVGETFTVSFTGTSIGLLRQVRPDGGRLSCQFDGGTAKTIDFWDSTAPTDTYVDGAIDFPYMASGTHHLSCTVLADRPSSSTVTSTGNAIYIGGFLTDAAKRLTL